MAAFVWVILIGSAAAILFWLAWWLLIQWRIRSLNWPKVEGPLQLERYCDSYLSRFGWETHRRYFSGDPALGKLPEEVCIVARKDEKEIGIAAEPYPSLAMFNPLFGCEGRVVIITTTFPIPDMLREEGEVCGVPVLHYKQLPELDRYARRPVAPAES